MRFLFLSPYLHKKFQPDCNGTFRLSLSLNPNPNFQFHLGLKPQPLAHNAMFLSAKISVVPQSTLNSTLIPNMQMDHISLNNYLVKKNLYNRLLVTVDISFLFESNWF